MTTRASLAEPSARWSSFAGGLGILLLPKCPLCFLGYVAALSYLGLDAARVWSAFRVVLLACLALSVAVVTALSVLRRDPLPAALAIGGVTTVIVGCALSQPNILPEVGAVVVFAAACLNAWRCGAARAPSRRSRAVPPLP